MAASFCTVSIPIYINFDSCNFREIGLFSLFVSAFANIAYRKRVVIVVSDIYVQVDKKIIFARASYFFHVFNYYNQ